MTLDLLLRQPSGLEGFVPLNAQWNLRPPGVDGLDALPRPVGAGKRDNAARRSFLDAWCWRIVVYKRAADESWNLRGLLSLGSLPTLHPHGTPRKNRGRPQNPHLLPRHRSIHPITGSRLVRVRCEPGDWPPVTPVPRSDSRRLRGVAGLSHAAVRNPSLCNDGRAIAVPSPLAASLARTPRTACTAHPGAAVGGGEPCRDDTRTYVPPISAREPDRDADGE